MRNKNLLVLVVLSLIVISGCSSANNIKIVGSSDVEPLMKVWASEYQKSHKDVKISIKVLDDDKAVSEVINEKANLAIIGRGVSPDEVGSGISYYLPLVADGVFAIVNKDNNFNVAGSKDLYSALWINGTQLVWPNNETVVVYTRKDVSGVANTWASFLASEQTYLQGKQVVGDKGIVEAVRKDVRGLGYASLESVFDLDSGLPVDGVRVVPLIVGDQLLRINNLSDAVLSIKLGLYPVPRLVYVVRKDGTDVRASGFVKWVYNEGQAYVEKGGFIGLSDKDLEIIRGKI